MGQEKTIHTVRKLLDLAWERHSAAFHEEVMDYYQEAIGLARNSSEEKIEAEIYDRMGLYFLNNNNAEEARHYFSEALRIKRSLYGQVHYEIAQSYNNIGLSYGKLKRHKDELEHLQKSVEILQRTQFEGKQKELALRYNNIGVCFGKLRQYKQQLDYLQRALEENLQIFGPRHQAVAANYINIGRYHTTHGNFDKALDCYSQAESIYAVLFPKGHKYLTGMNNAIGEVHLLRKDYKTALGYFQKAVLNESRSEKPIDILQNPPLEDLRITAYLFSALRLKGKTLLTWYQAFPEKEKLLAAALDVYRRINELIHYTRRSINADDSKLILAEKAHLIYEDAITATLLTYEKTGQQVFLEKAFHYSENSKALILLSSMKDTGARVRAKISPQLLEVEQTLRSKMSEIDSQIRSETQKKIEERDEGLLSQLESSQFRLKQKSAELIRRLEREYEQYYHLKYQVDPVSVAKLQSALGNKGKKEVIIEYYLGESHLFIFFISSNQLKVKQFGRPPDLENTLRKFETGLSANLGGMFKQAATRLYELLIQPVNSFINKGDVIRFIPDGVLHNIPFESLRLSSGGESSKFLIQDHPVVYHYSATLWHHILKLKRPGKPAEGFLGIAPVHFKAEKDEDLELPTLENSVFEVEETARLFESKGIKSTTLKESEATKPGVFAYMPQHRFVLISTHGFVEKKHPSLSGICLAKNDNSDNDGRFYVSDAYNLDIKSELVVLSACESGVGAIRRGEGMIALNRGFLMAGARNVIYALFKIPENASGQLVTTFFKELLQQDEPPDLPLALRQAKLGLIENGASPYEWAGLALLGV